MGRSCEPVDVVLKVDGESDQRHGRTAANVRDAALFSLVR